MNVFFVKNGVTLLWLLLIAALLVVIGIETDWGRHLRREFQVPHMSSSATSEAGVLPLFSLSALDDAYKESAERPLFVPARRPPPPAPPPGAAPPPPMPRGQFKLMGTIVNSDMSLAYLKEIASNRTLRIDKGAEVNGMKLEVVEASRVVLRRGDDTEELQLKSGGSPKVQANVAGLPNVTTTAGPGQAGAEASASGMPSDQNAPNRRRRIQNLPQGSPQ